MVRDWEGEGLKVIGKREGVCDLGLGGRGA